MKLKPLVSRATNRARVAHKFGSNGAAELRCLDGSAADNSDIGDIEIIATKVAKVAGN